MTYLFYTLGYLGISVLMSLLLTYLCFLAEKEVDMSEHGRTIILGGLCWPFMLLTLIVIIPAAILSETLEKRHKTK